MAITGHKSAPSLADYPIIGQELMTYRQRQIFIKKV